MPKITGRPVPVPDDLTRPYWESAKEHRLTIQCCQACQNYFHPPVQQCPDCESHDLKFEAVSGRGTIYSYTRIHDTRLKGFEPALPYPVVQVELAEQPGLLVICNMAETDPSAIKVGAVVEVVFEEIDAGMVLPDFRLVKADAA